MQIILIALGVAMDAFAVSICKGSSIKKINFKNVIIIGLYFGLFQGFMPLIGYFLGNSFENLISSIDHWIAFILLVFIGSNMVKESFKSCDVDDKIDFKTMLLLSIATSIDALTIGVTFNVIGVNYIVASLIILFITFILSCIGVIIGNKISNKFGKPAQIFGGIILIGMGIYILITHLGIL